MSETPIELVKNKLLSMAASGIYVNFQPDILQNTYNEISKFLSVNAESIDTIELFNLYEMQFYISLMTNHDVEAKTSLDRLVDQFGFEKSQRVKLLQSIYFEAMGDDEAAMKVLGQNADELKLSRRLVTFSRKPDNNEDYIASLNYYLDLQPSDVITWAELADEYKKIGHYEKGIHCLQEILLQEPYAYNIFYKVGLFYYYQFLQEFTNKTQDKKDKLLEAISVLNNAKNNFLRSIEICDSYSTSWLGIYLISKLDFNQTLLNKLADNKQVKIYLEDNSKLEALSKQKIIKFNTLDGEEEFDNFLNKHV